MLGPSSRAAIALLLASCNSGCGILLQSALGWSDEQTHRERIQHAVRVDAPEDAEVSRIDPSGEVVPLGTGPLVDELGYDKVVVRREPKTMGLVIGGLVSAGVGAALIYGASTVDDGCLDSEPCLRTGSTLASTGYVAGATLAILGALTDLTVALVYSVAGSGVRAARIEGETHYVYRAALDGQTAEASLEVPDRYRVTLAPGSTAADPTLVGAPAAPPSAAIDHVVAVMEVEDVNADTDKALEANLVTNVGDQLRIFVAQSGARTIDRGAQQVALREQIRGAKSDSYAACYDDACQIELGKALAASHILRARITRFGSRCVLNAELVDLRAEVTVKAASARGGCEAEGFLTMAEAVAQQVTRR